MVPIVNAMGEFNRRSGGRAKSEIGNVEADILHSLKVEVDRCVDKAVNIILEEYKTLDPSSSSTDFVIGTFSRSSTLKMILERVLSHKTDVEQSKSIRVVCSQSTPGNEGEIMANDITSASWLPDSSFLEKVRDGEINLVVVGADCILSDQLGIVNKIGTKEVALVCKASNVPIKCFADRFKLWDDSYPPPLEDIFEVIPQELIDEVIVPSKLDAANTR